ncbi:MAG: hypothetical protein ABIU96_11025 [Rhodanobacter sp.]
MHQKQPPAKTAAALAALAGAVVRAPDTDFAEAVCAALVAAVVLEAVGAGLTALISALMPD